MVNSAMLNPAVIDRLCDAIRRGPITPEVAQLIDLSGILAHEYAAATAKIAEAPKPSPHSENWETRTEKPRPLRDIAAEYAAEMEKRTTKPADILARRAASLSPQFAEPLPASIAPPGFSERLVPRAAAEPSPDVPAQVPEVAQVPGTPGTPRADQC
jgi:hypothetical protein